MRVQYVTLLDHNANGISKARELFNSRDQYSLIAYSLGILCLSTRVFFHTVHLGCKSLCSAPNAEVDYYRFISNSFCRSDHI